MLCRATDYGERIAPDCLSMRSVGPMVGSSMPYAVHAKIKQLWHASDLAQVITSTACIWHMLRTLTFIEARHSFSLRPEYISTTDNHLVDDLSRDILSFQGPHCRCFRNTPPCPTGGPTAGPHTGFQQFSDIFKRDSPLQPVALTDLQ